MIFWWINSWTESEHDLFEIDFFCNIIKVDQCFDQFNALLLNKSINFLKKLTPVFLTDLNLLNNIYVQMKHEGKTYRIWIQDIEQRKTQQSLGKSYLF